MWLWEHFGSHGFVTQRGEGELSVTEQREQVGGLYPCVHALMCTGAICKICIQVVCVCVFVHVDAFVCGSQRCTSAKERNMPCWQSGCD